jgi:2,3-bisphosphoglycerate-dependent phosphoglycerate mutase
MPLLISVRHGQSQWNLENRFTGEFDCELTDQGRKEAKDAGKKLRGIRFNHCFTSSLKRAQETLSLILEEAQHPPVPVTQSSALNERNYGDLQGLNKAETAARYGDAQVALWRRSYNTRPPGGESLKDTADRVIPYYRQQIEPFLQKEDNILIVAHGNSLRALMMYLEQISPAEIVTVNIPTGIPRLYEFDQDLKITREVYL